MSNVEMFLRGYNPTPIEPRENALMRGLEIQRARQGNALQAMQMQAYEQQQREAAAQRAQAQAAQQQRQGYLASVSGQVGPPQPFNPLEAYAAGLPADAIRALTPAPRKVYSLSPGGKLADDGGNVIAEAPFKPEPQKLPQIGELQAYRDQLPKADPRRREVQSLIDNQTRAPKYATPDPAPKVDAPPKPLPPGALKMQQDALDKIGIAASINADLGAVAEQIKSGKLKFGPVSNLANQGLNMVGLSTQESRNFASFKSTMERLRNESLRLNAGVQTDGDAQRAWNELFQNINDTDLVQQRLIEIQGINARGAELQRLRADSVRANYGLPPIDVEQYAAQPPALNIPAGAKPPAIGGAPAAAKPARSGPAVGTVENGYRFKGGDPASQASWEKVK